MKTHGMSKTRFYTLWVGMKNRCYNPNRQDYAKYGAKGIRVSEEWQKFINFKNDMYESYLEHVSIHGESDTSLDRIDSEKDYSKENCRWATMIKQLENRKIYKPSLKKKIAISPEGKEYVFYKQIDFANKLNINVRRINNCLTGRNNSYKGWVFKYEEVK